jgi:hypothetical protein
MSPVGLVSRNGEAHQKFTGPTKSFSSSDVCQYTGSETAHQSTVRYFWLLAGITLRFYQTARRYNQQGHNL